MGQGLIALLGSRRLTGLSRVVIDELREDLKSREADGLSKESLLDEAGSLLRKRWSEAQMLGVRRVINATGVMIHTNLGRAPLSEAARDALLNAAGYCTVEYDLRTGERGIRGVRAEAMLCELTGAEGALVVNNCAAAAYLVLTTFASGREVVISRGELVEIGGEFRVPDVLARSGAALTEVGTTNRTKLDDYENAITDKTSMILKVHPSNYRIVGFTKAPSLEELADLAHRKGVMIYEDAGSGVVSDLSSIGLSDEPVISQSIGADADVVTFSGDKLLGGPQAGIIVGRSSVTEKLRKDPLYRALRVSKLIYAALEATLESHLRGDASRNIPVLRMARMEAEQITNRSSAFIKRVANQNIRLELIEGKSAIGGGSAPLVHPATTLIAIEHHDLSAFEVEARLRENNPPAIARILNDRVMIDLRTVSEMEETELAAAIDQL